MTVEETMQLRADDVKSLSAEKIKELPTIIEVLEYLSCIENQEVQKTLDFSYDALNMTRNGYYNWISDQPWTNIPKLMPLSQSPFLFLRGQNRYFEQSFPSIFRVQTNINEEEYFVVSRVKSAEFLLVCKTHPVICELSKVLKVEDLAIAQHYGFPTEYMDITNYKWVAAFFATTLFNDNSYQPVETGFGNGYGIIYMSKNNVNLLMKTVFNKFCTLGFQYFARPSSQNSLMYKVERGENFDAHPAFDRIVFRHNTEASKLVYNYSFHQNRFFPKDTVSEIAREIRKPEYKISNNAIAHSKSLGVTQTDEEIKSILNKHQIGLSGDDFPIAHFSTEVLQKDWQDWNNYGRANLFRHIIPPIPVYKL